MARDTCCIRQLSNGLLPLLSVFASVFTSSRLKFSFWPALSLTASQFSFTDCTINTKQGLVQDTDVRYLWLHRYIEEKGFRGFGHSDDLIFFFANFCKFFFFFHFFLIIRMHKCLLNRINDKNK